MKSPVKKGDFFIYTMLLEAKTTLPDVILEEHPNESVSWAVSSSGLLIAVNGSNHQDTKLLFGEKDIRIMERPPNFYELDDYKGLISVDHNSGMEDPLKVRAYWEAQNGVHALGALFPALRPEISGFEVLNGVLFPKTLNYAGNLSGELISPWLNALNNKKTWCLTRVLTPEEQRQNLDRLLFPKKGPYKVAIYGLGDIGSLVAQNLYVQDKTKSNIDSLLIASRNPQSVDALALELEDMRTDGERPELIKVNENFNQLFTSDVIIFAASAFIPPADSSNNNLDVRAIQYPANSRILKEFMEQANQHQWKGMLLVASDPVEQLTMSAFQAARGTNNNQRFAGFGAAINYSRAASQAEAIGLSAEELGVFNTHGKLVIVIPFDSFTEELAENLSRQTGLRNYEVRRLNKKPWRAPAQQMTQAINNILVGETTWASPFLPGPTQSELGAYFATRVQPDISRGLLTPINRGVPNVRIFEILDRGQRFNSLTSNNPGLLHTDPFSVNRDGKHPAFNQQIFDDWLKKATIRMEEMNQPYLSLADLAHRITNDLLVAIDQGRFEDESELKRSLNELIEITLNRDGDLIDEQLDLMVKGFVGGEVLAGVTYHDIPKTAKYLFENIDVHSRIDWYLNKISEISDPTPVRLLLEELDEKLPVPLNINVPNSDGEYVSIHNFQDLRNYFDSLSDLEFFPLEVLKYPHLAIRAYGWKILAEKISGNSNISYALAKKLFTLCHFGDDFTLYQFFPDEKENKDYLNTLYEAESKFLQIISQQDYSDSPIIDNSVILGTTGAPIGFHHIEVLKAGLNALGLRYPETINEGFISIDDFSRSKAKDVIAGRLPSLPLRRRIAFLQTLNDLNIHVLLPPIPIWFDINNNCLQAQMTRSTPEDSRAWRMLGGDSLARYPKSPAYQVIPHVIDMRGFNRDLMDNRINELNIREVVQLDSRNQGSSSSIRSELSLNGNSHNLNPLTLSFINHYKIFQNNVEKN